MDRFYAYLDEKDSLTILTDKKSSFTINGDFLNAYFLKQQDSFYIYKAHYAIDIQKNYCIKDDYQRECLLQIRYFVKDALFDEMFYYDGQDLGSIYHEDYTKFKLWAPIASKVILHYEIHEEEYDIEMIRKENGTFEITIEGNLENAFYFYKITNNGEEQNVVDPYAYSSNANSKKSAVINWKKTMVEGESNTSSLKPFNQITDAIIYEISVRDFSMDGSLGEEVKGTFKAFLKHHILSKNGHPLGIDYLKDLGVTHLQLMPIFDFVTVDEEHPFFQYNWGYDPFCYNSLEGSYSSNPNNPYSRIIEAKEMISELHKNGLRVVLDVVFNHTYSFKDSLYNKIVPNYYYLMDKNGKLSNGSFCGNDLDSTRKMVHKYIKDMCKRYVELYHIDGLRFDLMGILTKELIMDIYSTCKAINPSFILYGEGWDMPSLLPSNLRASLPHANEIPQIAFFNDYFRDIVSGKTSNNFSSNQGYLTGNTSLYYAFLKAMRGSIEQDCYFQNVTSSINYIECHDNFTLWDKLKITNAHLSDDERNDIQLCCIAALLFAQGIPFLHAGMEFHRSKNGNDNSYNAGDDINKINWQNVDLFYNSIQAIKDFIQIRKTFPCFNITDRKKILNSIDGQLAQENILMITYAFEGMVILLIFNPNKDKQSISLNGEYSLLANQYGYVKKSDRTYRQIDIKAYSFLMLIK